MTLHYERTVRATPGTGGKRCFHQFMALYVKRSLNCNYCNEVR